MIILIIHVLIIFHLSCAGNEKLQIIDREAWGSLPVIEDTLNHTIKYITIHHSGVYVSPDKDPSAYLRNLQEWSRGEKQWTDIPYHYLIDLEGRIYEGRPAEFPGDTNTDYDPRGHLLISVIGNYEEQPFSDEQYDALVRALVYFCELYTIDPSLIKSHRDYTETACPGRNIYQYFENGRLISDVNDKLHEHKKK